MGKVLSFANFKGGVGKTSTTALVSYNLAKMGYKILLIDFDAQANLTSLMLKTAAKEEEIITIENSLMSVINDGESIEKSILHLLENLDLVPNAVDFSVYSRFLERNFKEEIDKVSFFRKFMEPVRDKYDLIFIDVPPTLSLLNDSAFYACDDIIVVLQTQERSLIGSETFLDYLEDTLLDEFHANLDVIGILPVLSNKISKIDEEILQSAKDLFGSENIFEHKIAIMERIKRMDLTGITNKDGHDRNVHKAFKLVAEELIERLEAEYE